MKNLTIRIGEFGKTHEYWKRLVLAAGPELLEPVAIQRSVARE